MTIQTLGKFVVVDIHKPLGVQADYDFVRVRDVYFEAAKRRKYRVLVRTPNGERVFSDAKGLKMVEETMLFPDRPMKLYECTVPHGDKKPDDYWVFA